MSPALLDLLLPPSCPGCGAPGTSCCRRCLGEFTTPFPIRCGLPTAVACYALAPYRDAARQLVLAYKERGRRDLAPVLGGVLAQGCASVTSGPVCLVPVPSRRSQSRTRGGQHMLAVARHCAAELAGRGRECLVAPALALGRGARDAVGLDRARRAQNLAGRVRPVPDGLPLADAAVVLVDDIVTTGETAKACLAALSRAGVTTGSFLALTCAGGER